MRLFQLQAFLDAALIAGVEHDLLVATQRVVSLEDMRRVRVRHLFDGDDDLHDKASSWGDTKINYRWDLRRHESAGNRPEC